MKAGISAAVALAGVTNAWAAVDYRCMIERTVSASEQSLGHVLIGKQFTVKGQTGMMAGALKNSYLTNPQVIDHGSAETSFKVVTAMRKDQGAGSNIYALKINEYEQTTRKTFIFLSNDKAFLGWCEHF